MRHTAAPRVNQSVTRPEKNASDIQIAHTVLQQKYQDLERSYLHVCQQLDYQNQTRLKEIQLLEKDADVVIAELKLDNQALRQELEQLRAASFSQINSLELFLANKDISIEGYLTIIQELKIAISERQSDIKALSADNDLLAGTVRQMRPQLYESDLRLVQMNGVMAKIKEELEEVRTYVSDLQEGIKNCPTCYVLKRQNDQLNRSVSYLDSQLVNFRKARDVSLTEYKQKRQINGPQTSVFVQETLNSSKAKRKMPQSSMNYQFFSTKHESTANSTKPILQRPSRVLQEVSNRVNRASSRLKDSVSRRCRTLMDQSLGQ